MNTIGRAQTGGDGLGAWILPLKASLTVAANTLGQLEKNFESPEGQVSENWYPHFISSSIGCQPADDAQPVPGSEVQIWDVF